MCGLTKKIKILKRKEKTPGQARYRSQQLPGGEKNGRGRDVWFELLDGVHHVIASSHMAGQERWRKSKETCVSEKTSLCFSQHLKESD